MEASPLRELGNCSEMSPGSAWYRLENEMPIAPERSWNNSSNKALFMR